MYAKTIPTGPANLPTDLVPYRTSWSDVTSKLIKVIPHNISPITYNGTNNSTYLKVIFPNLKSMRANQVILGCQLSANFTSTSMSDTFASLSPQFVPNISSLIGRITMRSGQTKSLMNMNERCVAIYNTTWNQTQPTG